MPPAVALGVGAGVSGLAGLGGAFMSSRQASKARGAAQQQYEFAQLFRPNLFAPSGQQQQKAYSNLFGARAQLYSPESTAAYNKALTNQFNRQTEVGRQQVAESSARRGLYRSGIGAQQESQFLSNRGRDLGEIMAQTRLQQQQQQAQYGLALRAAQQQAMGSALGRQQDLFAAMLGQAGASGQAAAQQQNAAAQAWGNAFQGPASLLGTYGLMNAMGGFGGGVPGSGGSFVPQPLQGTQGGIFDPRYNYP